MKRILVSLLIGVFSFSVAYSAAKGPAKSVKMQKLDKSRMMEKEPSLEARDASYWNKPHSHSNRNGATSTLVDSSGNGYGLVVSMTKPIDATDDGQMVMSYRQYAGAGTTHGQLGAAVSEDGEEWEAYYNVNANGNPPWGGGIGVGNGGDDTAQARYPSAIASEDYPYALWTEYTGIGNGYGGQLYYSFDEFGWGGGSWMYPELVDLLWDNTKDLWTASPDMFYDQDADMMAVAVSAADWTRSNNYYFRSEVVTEEGTIIMGEEQIVIDEPGCLVAGDASGSFNTAPNVSIGENGFGVMGIIGLFPGGDEGTSEISNYHQPIFKVTEDYGQTWHGPDASDPCSFYYIGDDLFADMIASFPEIYVDECGGYEYYIVDFWSYYDFDYKVDANGNVHILMSVVPSDDYYVFWIDGAGWYHFTIDSAYLDNPGQVNTPTGWNWSKVASMEDTWVFLANDGQSSVWETQASLSFSKDNPDVVWVALDRKNDYACGEIVDDFGNDDPCDDLYEYPMLSSDIYVYKSTDGGSTWWNPINASDSEDNPDDYPDSWLGTCPDGLLLCGPEEMYPHAPQWSTEDEMYLMYQMPNWGFNEIGDLLGPDHMNRVYGAKIEVTTDSESDPIDCDSDTPPPSYVLGDVNADGAINILDIQSLILHILGTVGLEGDSFLAGDYNEDGTVDILDILSIVNIILDGRDSAEDATSAKFIISGSELSMEATGNVGAFEMTLSHSDDFAVELVAETELEGAFAYHTEGNVTKIVVVTPESGTIFVSNGNFEVTEVIAATTSGYINTSVVVPSAIAIGNAYPNPFNPSTSFEVNVGQTGNVSVMVYNVNGQFVDMIHEGPMDAGLYNMTWNANDFASGMYIIKANNADVTVSQKVMLVK